MTRPSQTPPPSSSPLLRAQPALLLSSLFLLAFIALAAISPPLSHSLLLTPADAQGAFEVKTDKLSYAEGETVRIAGKVGPVKEAGQQMVQIQVYNFQNTVYISATVPAAAGDGSFSYSFSIRGQGAGADAQPGPYGVVATYGGALAQTQFMVVKADKQATSSSSSSSSGNETSANSSNSELAVKTDRQSYGAGAPVVVTGSAGGRPVSIRVFDPAGKEMAVAGQPQLLPDGSFRYAFSAGRLAGEYRVVVVVAAASRGDGSNMSAEARFVVADAAGPPAALGGTRVLATGRVSSPLTTIRVSNSSSDVYELYFELPSYEAVKKARPPMGWTAEVDGTAVTFLTDSSPIGHGKTKTFRIYAVPTAKMLDWTAYDADGNVVDVGVASVRVRGLAS
jgi:hypothetical protein